MTPLTLSAYGFNHDRRMFDTIYFVVDKRHWSKNGSPVEEYSSHLKQESVHSMFTELRVPKKLVRAIECFE